jgi:hypothetical protein
MSSSVDPRIERLKQVRAQASSIARNGTQRYRSHIERDKSDRENTLKDLNKSKAKNDRDKLSEYLKVALNSQGESHRLANVAANELVEKIKKSDEELYLSSKMSLVRGKVAGAKLFEANKADDEKYQESKQVLETKRAFSADNREDIREFLESQRAKLAAERASERIARGLGRPGTNFTQNKADRFSTSIFERGMKPIHATVTIHGSTGRDATLIENSSEVEMTSAARRMYKTVLLQLKHNKQAVIRAKKARVISSIKKVTKSFEQDLALLYTLDRSGPRSNRIKNADSIPESTKDAEINHEFESLFVRAKAMPYRMASGGEYNEEDHEGNEDDNEDDEDVLFDEESRGLRDVDNLEEEEDGEDDDEGEGLEWGPSITVPKRDQRIEISREPFQAPAILIMNDSSSDAVNQPERSSSEFESSSESTARARHDRASPRTLRSPAVQYSDEPEFALTDSEGRFRAEPTGTPPSLSGVRRNHSTIRKLELQKYNDVIAQSVGDGRLHLTQTGKELEEAPLDEYKSSSASSTTSKSLSRTESAASESRDSYDVLANVVSIKTQVFDPKDSLLSSGSLKSSLSNIDDLNSSVLSSVDVELKSVRINDSRTALWDIDQSADSDDNLVNRALPSRKSELSSFFSSQSTTSVLDGSNDDSYLRDIKMRVSRIENVIAREQQANPFTSSDVFRSSSSSSSVYGDLADSDTDHGLDQSTES